ncbi:hypothetical protein OU994_11400 [Pseudoduganella sp. SL102]|uniref:hypothetical protein n=1 Tax=Pseudoduganella sp. SL102 TaxID=2995154 RepID=UPI00248C7A14|nr:hypothetical protein [Pseudoduganella sp. SL102]WBS04828.1 hypothetical protein OU994_11400 [Pseudoduganella sp. SL102]
MIKHIVLAAAMFGATAARAEVLAETECYVRVTPSNDGKIVRLIFRRYVDVELKKEVGSFVQYNHTKEIIPLVLSTHLDTDTESPDLGNYEDTRIEILGNRVTGEYKFIQTGAGHRQGRYVRYTSAKNVKPVIFHHTGSDDDTSCKLTTKN